MGATTKPLTTSETVGKRDGIAAVVAETEGTKIEADAKAARAAADVQLCEAAVGAAEAAHASTAGDDGARVLGAHDALRLARVRHDMAAKAAGDAAEGHRVALAALEHDKHERHLAELRKRAAPATLAKRIAAPWAVLLDARAKAAEAAKAIAAEHADSVAASTELRSFGEYVQDLSSLHAVLPAVAAAAERGLGANTLHGLSPNLGPNVDPVVELFALLQRLDHLEIHPAKAEWLSRQLAGLATCRTSIDLDALEREHAKLLDARKLDGYAAPTRQRATPQ